MREIKFRAWQDYGDGRKYMLYDRDDLVEFFDATLGDPIMQYTGLKDSKGVEIYEGDIIKYLSSYYGIVKFYNGSFVRGNDNGYADIDGENSEVIGNIYENPELLK